MPYTPYERLNVFDDVVSETLHQRRKSTSLVQTRTPFLRYTTTVDFGSSDQPNLTDSIRYLGKPYYGVDFKDYEGCKFFTVGLHGWDNLNYSGEDIYNSQSQKGLVVGTSYKNGTQKLIKTYADKTMSPQSYPPPGIESATVERLRNGNVLKMSINIVCHTQAQLDMLDVLAFAPGMDCVLEWGSLISTPTGAQKLPGPKSNAKILNFAKTQEAIETLQNIKANNSRVQFIQEWCEPNDFNYDFALAQIANVKTTLDNNRYTVTVEAYGRADNIMYISAYATTTTPTTTPTTAQSIHRYFAPSSYFKDDLQTVDKNSKLYEGIFLFEESIDAAKKAENPNTPIALGQINDIGLEDTYFIRFDKFINDFINTKIVDIINKGTRTTINKFVADIYVSDDNKITNTPLGWNKYLQSTEPSILLIMNPDAAGTAFDTRQMLKDTFDIKKNQLDSLNTDVKSLGAQQTDGFDITTKKVRDFNKDKTYQKLGKLSKIEGDENSGVMLPSTGIWLNSKGLQQIFLGARTITEGLETLLNKLNAATEGYWDLKLMYDEDNSTIRIVDDNVCGVSRASQGIYTFNKLLEVSEDNSVIGSDALSVKVNTDYPKLLFSQLAISAISNYSSQPDTRDLFNNNHTGKVKLNNRLKSLLKDPIKGSPVAVLDTVVTTAANTSKGSSIYSLLNENARLELYKDKIDQSVFDNIVKAFGGTPGVPGSEQIPSGVYNVLYQLLQRKTLLTSSEASRFADTIKREKLTPEKVNSIITFIKARDKALIDYWKNQETKNFNESIRGLVASGKIPTGTVGTGPLQYLGNQPFVTGKPRDIQGRAEPELSEQSKQVIQKIEASKEKLKGLFN